MLRLTSTSLVVTRFLTPCVPPCLMDVCGVAPRSTTIIGTANLISDLIEDGDFLRLQSLSIGYQFNTKKWSQDLGISSVRLYAQAQNLFCLTGYTGFDPEINSYYSSANLRSGIDLNTTPLTRTITFGANISF